jgi:hypothetical protein
MFDFPAFRTPDPGTIRRVRKFAWLPVKVGPTWVWLKRYTSEQQWALTDFCYNGPLYSWTEFARSIWHGPSICRH